MYALQYHNRRWTLGANSCFGLAVFRHMNAYTSMMSVALIALSKCLCILYPKAMRSIPTKIIAFVGFVIALTFSTVLVLPVCTEVV